MWCFGCAPSFVGVVKYIVFVDRTLCSVCGLCVYVVSQAKWYPTEAAGYRLHICYLTRTATFVASVDTFCTAMWIGIMLSPFCCLFFHCST